MIKKLVLLTSIGLFALHYNGVAQNIFDKVKQKVKEKSEQRVDEKIDKSVDKGLDEAENAAKKKTDEEQKPASEVKETKAATAETSIKTYQNYDFVPGDKILFEDNFEGDQDGEFPAHWELTSGQATLNKVQAIPAFFLTEGNYARVKPRMNVEKYLADPFTVEFDYYHIPGAYGVITQLQYLDKSCNCEGSTGIKVNENEVSYEGSVNFNKTYASGLEGEHFSNKWHHVAMAYKNHQLKVYVDQNRVLVVPDTKDDFYSVSFAGIGDEKTPVVFKNIRIASGGNMNMLGKKFTEAKIVTHGINFDVDKATIKPESMGTLNMIVQVMKDNPDLKFEVDGHTDNSGAAAHNLSLSQLRADAVKAQLVNMGIGASRLTAKGFGDSKPIADNTTIEGKANNRRVEFVKL